MSVKLVQLAKGKIIGTGDIHLEEPVPVDTDEPTSYVAKWDASRSENDKVTAYLTGSGNNLSLHIYGYGEMRDYSLIQPRKSPYYTAPWASYSARIKHLTVHDGITRVGQATFYGSTDYSNAPYSLSDVTISSTVRHITRYFLLHTSVSTLNLNSGIRRICEGAFAGRSDSVSNLSVVNIPNSTRIIDYSAFMDTQWFRNLSSEFTTVGDGCLIQYIGNASSLVIPDGTKCVALCNWSNKASCTNITLPDSLKYISTGAFCDYVLLGNMAIPENCCYISASAFVRCTSLSAVYIPENVRKIDSHLVVTATGVDTCSPTASPFYGANSNLKIYCGASSKPAGFDTFWDYTGDSTRATVYWGVTRQEYDVIINGGNG